MSQSNIYIYLKKQNLNSKPSCSMMFMSLYHDVSTSNAMTFFLGPAWSGTPPADDGAIRFQGCEGASEGRCLDGHHVDQLRSNRAAGAVTGVCTPSDDSTIRRKRCKGGTKRVSRGLDLRHIPQPECSCIARAAPEESWHLANAALLSLGQSWCFMGILKL